MIYEQDGVLSSMAPTMRRDFLLHLYAQTLNNVPFFRNLGESTLAALAHVVQPMMAIRQQVIMMEGSVGTEMYMIISGELEITREGLRLGFLSVRPSSPLPPSMLAGHGLASLSVSLLPSSQTRHGSSRAIDSCAWPLS